MKVRLTADEPRMVPAVGRSIDPDEVFEVPDDTPYAWDVPGVFEVVTAAPTTDDEEF